MLTGFIIVAFICWILGFVVNGFTFYNVMLLIPTIMFSARKFGIHCKLGNILTAEILFLFFSTCWRLLFNGFTLKLFIIGLILRIIFVCIIVYDDSVYVYVQEERKR
jgi:hypothetical protein